MSSAHELHGLCWRAVEAQHHVSTLRLVDDVDEQSVLERLIETTKPALPEECRHLHYLLSTPFRYNAPYPAGSRFRRAGMTDGVYYASEAVETAMAELAFHRLLFFADSPATPWPTSPAEYSAFLAAFKTARALDLTRPPLDADRADWMDAIDYAACQRLADTARDGDIDIIRYESVRAPANTCNLALLRCRVFTKSRPANVQTWRMNLRPSGVQAIREYPKLRISFDREAFTDDPRIAALNWDR